MPKKREHGLIPFGGVLTSKKTGIPISIGGALQTAPLTQEDKWEGPLPKGWKSSSRSSFYDSMSHDECEDEHEEGPTSTCMNKIDGHVDDPGAFCASLRDQVTGTTHWRHGGKKSS